MTCSVSPLLVTATLNKIFLCPAECVYGCRITPQQIFNRLRRAITDAQPNNFRRMSEQQSALLKIHVLCHNDEGICFRILLNINVFGFLHSGFADVLAVRIKVG